MLAAALSVAGQTPDCNLFAGWQQHGAARLFEGDNLFEYMDGNSEGYLVYGFVRPRLSRAWRREIEEDDEDEPGAAH